MDPLTHGLVGAAASQTALPEKMMRPAAAAGFAAAMMADLDFFIRVPSDPLFTIEIHRQFTHALIFIPVGALLATGVLWWFLKDKMELKRLYLCCFVAYATSGLLDACTSYGTQLLWPFTDTRFAWDVISVVDPLLTTGLLGWIGIGFYRENKRSVYGAWGWLFMFLIFGILQHERAKTALHEQALQRGHTVEKMVVKPTIANQILWRGTYIFEDRVYTYGIRSGVTGSVRLYVGESADLIRPDNRFSEYQGTTLYRDLKRFERLSEGFLIRHPDDPNVIGDARYSMLPTSLIPLWGVEADTTQTGRHLPFLYFRDAGEEVRKPFLHMLLGR